jgi:hypothetical protein
MTKKYFEKVSKFDDKKNKKIMTKKYFWWQKLNIWWQKNIFDDKN